MIKNYNQFINEDIRGKNITLGISYINLKQLYSYIQLKYNDDLKIVISYDDELYLNKGFYQALENDHINKDDILFENCEEILLYDINGFIKISDYGAFGENIKDFNCSDCDKLISLEGAPKEVDGAFWCSGCPNLTSLDGAPKEVGSYFCCSNCKNLMSLDGSPEIVNDEFDCNTCKNLTSLDGAPKTVVRDFVCIGCKNLTSLDGSPEKVDGDFRCRGCNPGFITLAIEKYGKDKVKS